MEPENDEGNIEYKLKISPKSEKRKNGNNLQKQIAQVEKEVKGTKAHVDTSIQLMRKESHAHIENIENVLFAHRQLQQKNQVKFDWIMQDYQRKFRLGKIVYSPVFDTKVEGFSIQLNVEWTGLSKENVGVYLATLFA